MREIPKAFEKYRHFKGNIYQILNLAKDSETMEDVVVYQALYGDYQVYVRPLAMFMSEVDRDKYPDIQATYRFEKVECSSNSGQSIETQTQTQKQTESKVNTDSNQNISDVTNRNNNVGLNSVESNKVETSGNGTLDKMMQEDQNSSAESEEENVPDKRADMTSSETSESEAEFAIDPAVMEFLDVNTYGQKLNVLASLRHRITDDMITTMAVASDLEVEDGPVEVRYEQLKNCLLTKEKYECVRIR